jgi:hypothetical protein
MYMARESADLPKHLRKLSTFVAMRVTLNFPTFNFLLAIVEL